MDLAHDSTKIYGAFSALLFLLALTMGLSFLLTGVVALVAGLTIATLKLLLIAIVFMELDRPRSVIRLTALAGSLWLSLLMVGVLADYSNRGRGETESGSLRDADQMTAFDRLEP